MTREEEIREYTIYEDVNVKGETIYVNSKKEEFTTVDGICINGLYYTTSTTRYVQVVHVDKEKGYVFFKCVTGYHMGIYWKCNIEPFKRQFFIRPQKKSTTSVGGCVNVVIDKDFNILKRNLNIKLEGNNR